ncbi:MAG: hypothetical protein JJE04_16755 [Acidobacteriia bacterium]|nr:hypothetical protein [Terriglobia bacterium]
MDPQATEADFLAGSIELARSQAREQLAAAWQMHIASIEENLRNNWQRHLDHLLEERFSELGHAIEAKMEARLVQEVECARRTTARHWSERVNQCSRRLRQSGNQEEWTSALLDAAAQYCGRAALFALQGEQLRVEKSVPPLVEPFVVTLGQAPAFGVAVETLDPVVAAATANELSGELMSAMNPNGSGRVHLFPVTSRGKAVAVLYADGGHDVVDGNALELLATVAGAVWESRSAMVDSEASGLISIQGAKLPAASPAWNQLPQEEQDQHLKAQRFAKVQVAEMMLYRSQAVKHGRAEHSLYAELRDEIERGRTTFQRQFLENSPSMADYLHVEMIRTLTNDEPTLMGADYPGPLA